MGLHRDLQPQSQRIPWLILTEEHPNKLRAYTPVKSVGVIQDGP